MFVASRGYFTIWCSSGFLCGILQLAVVVCVMLVVCGRGHAFHEPLLPLAITNSPILASLCVCIYLLKNDVVSHVVINPGIDRAKRTFITFRFFFQIQQGANRFRRTVTRNC